MQRQGETSYLTSLKVVMMDSFGFSLGFMVLCVGGRVKRCGRS